MNIKIGLEIHQQLNTKTKLFSRCPIIKSQSFPIEFERKIRASTGESGKIDISAFHESEKNQLFRYKANSESSDLVDMDEEPPSKINQEALNTVIQLCKLLNVKIADEIQIMRKNVVDGSVVSGFQRTALVGTGGYIQINKRKIGISTVCIEEDSSVKANDDYRIDRQGIPLIEIATEPDMKSAEEVKEIASHIGLLLRSLNVMRGIGTIRQDINISIENGSRVEIKGFQDLKSITKIVNDEIKRQRDLLEIKKTLLKREKISFENPFNVTDIFSKTKCNFIKNKNVMALKLPKFGGILKKDCGDKTLGKELSDYAGYYGYAITHTEEDLKKYFLEKEFEELKKITKSGDMDTILIVAGDNPEKAINFVLERAKNILKGVPEETRVVEKMSSKYARPLPGGYRMYPETDIPSIIPDIKISIPETLIQKKKKLLKKMPEEIVSNILKSKYFNLFETLCRKTKKIEPSFIAGVLTSNLKDLSRKGFSIEDDKIEQLIIKIDEGKIPKSSVLKSLEMLAKNKKIEDVISEMKPMNEKEIRNIVIEVVKKNPNLNESGLMGIIMGMTKGKADGKSVSKILKNILNS